MKKLENAYALIIGVEEHNLNTFIDVNAIYNILINEDIAGYDPNNVIYLKGKETTRKHILDAFDKLKEITNEESSIFLYYTGHGGYSYEEYFIQPYGFEDPVKELYEDPKSTNSEVEELFKNTWVSAQQLKEKLNGLKPKRLVFFLDCCHAAGITQGFNMHSPEKVKANRHY